MSDLDRAILERHSTRMFLPRSVPRELVDEALALAQHAPSNSNIQPWRLVFASGAARGRLKDALFRVADHETPHIPALPKAFEHYRYELGAEVYGSMGITIADTARHAAAVMSNFDFFGAPLAGIVSMHRDLGPADAIASRCNALVSLPVFQHRGGTPPINCRKILSCLADLPLVRGPDRRRLGPHPPGK